MNNHYIGDIPWDDFAIVAKAWAHYQIYLCIEWSKIATKDPAHWIDLSSSIAKMHAEFGLDQA